MAEPFFSILLPTRNRSSILGDAIKSALAQSFGDFELILSDNDESPTATAEVVRTFSDPRIRYFRTAGNLAMHENWENALNLAQGRHVLVLEDKVRMVPNALEILHQHLQKLGDVVISFDLAFAKSATMDGPKSLPSAKRIETREVVDLFCRFRQRFFTVFPKGLDSCTPRSLLLNAKASSPTGMLFSYISPDYAHGFMVLAQVPGYYRLDTTLFYIPNNWMWKGQFSNGQASYKRTDAYRQFLKSLPVTRDQILKNVPVKTEFLWINAVIYDFETFYPQSRPEARIDWVNYFGFCHVLLVIGRKLGADMLEQRAAIRAALRERSLGFRLQVQLNLLQRYAGLGVQALKSFLR